MEGAHQKVGVCLSNKKKNLGVGYMALCVVAGGMVEFGFLLTGAVCVVGGKGVWFLRLL